MTIILCIGMIRSGSTWSYNYGREILKATRREMVEGGYSETIIDWVQSLPRHVSGIIKCHGLDPQSLDYLKDQPRPVRAIFTYRDAGEAIASAIRAFGQEFEQQAGSIFQALEMFRTCSQNWPTLAIRYDEIEEESTASTIALFLGTRIGLKKMKGIYDNNRRDTAVQALKTVNWQSPDGIYRDETYIFHRASLLHRTHFADHAHEREQFDFTPARKATLAALAAGYHEAGLFTGPRFYSNIN